MHRYFEKDVCNREIVYSDYLTDNISRKDLVMMGSNYSLGIIDEFTVSSSA